MKRLALFTIACLLALTLQSSAWMPLTVVGGGVPAGGAPAFCASENWCYTFEGADDPAWDSEFNTADCNYDTDGDYCNDDTTNYHTWRGAEGFGLRGAFGAAYFYDTLSASITAGEFYIEFSVYFDETPTADVWLVAWDVGGQQKVRVSRSTVGGDIQITVKNFAVNLDTNYVVSIDTWYHLGIYFKDETGSNDGIVRLYSNTSGDDFVFGDQQYSNTAVDTDTSYDFDEIRFRGAGTNVKAYFDDVKIDSGDPGWPTS